MPARCTNTKKVTNVTFLHLPPCQIDGSRSTRLTLHAVRVCCNSVWVSAHTVELSGTLKLSGALLLRLMMRQGTDGCDLQATGPEHCPEGA